MITYDTQKISLQKTAYIDQQGLGGAMWWELSGDAPEETGRNLVRTVKEAIGGLEWRENELRYPGSSKSGCSLGARTDDGGLRVGVVRSVSFGHAKV